VGVETDAKRMGGGAMIHPFVALMRRYVFDYTNSHDLSVCDEIMHPEYRVHISGRTLDRDGAYKSAVAAVFEEYPGLQIQVHEIVTNGEVLAMRFTEHGASVRHGGRYAAWSGIGIYHWNGRQLTSNVVEQDFFARRQQLTTGEAAPIEPPHHDPWVGVSVDEPVRANEEVVRSWLATGDMQDVGAIIDRRKQDAMMPSALQVEATRITSLFSAGNKVAFHAVQAGRYRGGLLRDDAAVLGCSCELCIVGIATVVEGRMDRVTLVTDREGTRGYLSRRARSQTL
jgi:predicted ester cyclase